MGPKAATDEKIGPRGYFSSELSWRAPPSVEQWHYLSTGTYATEEETSPCHLRHHVSPQKDETIRNIRNWSLLFSATRDCSRRTPGHPGSWKLRSGSVRSAPTSSPSERSSASGSGIGAGQSPRFRRPRLRPEKSPKLYFDRRQALKAAAL